MTEGGWVDTFAPKSRWEDVQKRLSEALESGDADAMPSVEEIARAAIGGSAAEVVDRTEEGPALQRGLQARPEVH